ncbi:MAG: bifunctional DNA-formamidopyrimidine glycosylase/DNA-(apurinic or apyrimidinic site) lyase [Armatimonadota bacterium]
MPELPEVEVVRRGVARALKGKTVRRVTVLRPQMLVHTSPRQLQRRLKGRALRRVRRRGKVLMLDFGDHMLLVHLGMTGLLLAQSRADPLPSHPRVILDFEDNSRLVFDDTRTFGGVELVQTDRLADAHMLRNVGPDVYANSFDGAALLRSFEGHRRDIKTHLLDQTHFSGLGNIYACEALHRARISPRKRCHRITPEQARRLGQAIRRVLRAGIEAGGTTFSDYRTPEGREGQFRRMLRVYGREGRRCKRPGCPGTIRRIVQAQRSTFYCPACQRG